MRRLLWKEWRERWPWFALWLAAVAVVNALGKGQGIDGTIVADAKWPYLPIGTALLAGLTAFGSELRGERAHFIASRPIAWPQLLLAKLLPGLATALLAGMLGAALLYVSLPADYLPLVHPARFLLGTLGFAGITLITYLGSAGCSIAMPGLGGSILTFLIWAGLYYIGTGIYYGIGLTFFGVSRLSDPFYLLIGYLAAPLAAAIVVARFGLTLGRGIRLLRFVLLLLAPIGIGLLADEARWAGRLPPAHAPWSDSGNGGYPIAISPSGRIGAVAVREDDRSFMPREHWRLVRFPTQSTELIQGLDPRHPQLAAGWLEDDTLVLEWDQQFNYDSRRVPSYSLVRGTDGRPRADAVAGPEPDRFGKDVRLDRYALPALVSPDRRRLLIAYRYGLVAVDARARRATAIAWMRDNNLPISRLSAAVPDPENPYARCWWQSDDVVGYIDPRTSARVLVRVSMQHPARTKPGGTR